MTETWIVEIEQENEMINGEIMPTAFPYTLPVATDMMLGGVMPEKKSEAMNKVVGVDEQGRLWTENSEQDLTGYATEDYVSQAIEKIELMPGPQGPKGEDGTPGKDGYTPVKGVDYFDGKDGAIGQKGDKGDKGDTGDTGAPGKDAPQESILYIPQELTDEQKAQALKNLGLDELLTVGGAWEKVADITLNERVLTVNIPVDGSQYNALYLRGSIAAWVVADEAPYSGSSMLSGARCCGIRSIPYSIHGTFTGFDVLMLNVGDNFDLPFAIGANGNSAVNGSVLTYNPIDGRRQIVSNINASAWSSNVYHFMEGSTFELWGVKK